MPRSAKPWFRVYSEALESLKLQQLKPDLKWTWFNLMCLANITRPRGSLPGLTYIAYRLRVKERDIEADLGRLEKAGLLDHDGDRYVMHDWEEWQKDSDVRGSSVPDSGPVAGRYKEDSVAEPAKKRPHSVPLEERRGKGEKEKEERRGGSGPLPARNPDDIDQLAADFAAFGKVNAGTAQAIQWAVKDHGVEAVRAAIRAAAAGGADGQVPWSYVDSILENRGSGDGARTNGRNPSPAPIPTDPDDPSLYRPRRFVVHHGGKAGSEAGEHSAQGQPGVGDER